MKVYIDLCCRGELYAYLISELGLPDKDAAKEMCFTVLFGYARKNPDDWKDIEKAFARLFPNVFEYCVDFKRREGYWQLACDLQGVESDLVISQVCGGLIAADDAMPLYTIHDSILTTARYVETVQDAFRSAAARLGLAVTVRVEPA